MSAATRRKVELARLEADVAYFHARLEMLGEPSTPNQNAQRKAFRHLYKHLSSQVAAELQTQTKAFSLNGLFDG
jgi:hypothetical protein